MLPANKIAKFSDQQYSLYQWLDHYDSLSPDKQLRKEDDETTIFDGCDQAYPAISKKVQNPHGWLAMDYSRVRFCRK